MIFYKKFIFQLYKSDEYFIIQDIVGDDTFEKGNYDLIYYAFVKFLLFL